LAAAVGLLGSAAAAVLVPVVPAAVPPEAELPVLVQVPPGLVLLVVAQVPPEALQPHLLPLPLPQAVVESEVILHLQGRQLFSAAMARSSPPTVQPTYARAPSTRKANTTSYYKGDGSLWVKLVSSGDILGSGPANGPSGGASLQVSR
jgi:hypothetical protein